MIKTTSNRREKGQRIHKPVVAVEPAPNRRAIPVSEAAWLLNSSPKRLTRAEAESLAMKRVGAYLAARPPEGETTGPVAQLNGQHDPGGREESSRKGQLVRGRCTAAA